MYFFFSLQLPLKCLTHGELYERNVLFKQTPRRSKTGNGELVQVSVDFADEEGDLDDDGNESKSSSHVDISAILTDWKHANISSPSSDLAFFFLSSTSQSMRQKYTQDWLEQYYFSFTECLRSKFGIKSATQFPEFDFDVFCKDFRGHIYKAQLQVIQSRSPWIRFRT